MKANTLPAGKLRQNRSLSQPVPVAARLVHQLLKRIKYGSLTLIDGDRRITFGTESRPQCSIRINSSTAYNKILQGGVVGAAEAYMDGDWSTENLTGVVRLFVSNRTVMEKMQSEMSWLKRMGYKLFHFLRRDTIKGSKRNIADHYDLGNEFFKLFLDPTMMYSAAVFKDSSDTMEQASLNKLDVICKKLALTPDDHLLEIGTGWGGLAEFAARNYGCQVTTTTISEEQFRHARERMSASGLEDRVTVLKEDYRNLTGTYDKLVSVEMIEAIGLENLPVFFEKCGSLLKEDGSMLLQSITIADQRYEQASKSVDFIQRYIFPGGALPSITALTAAATAASDLRSYQLEDITEHYAETLNRWREAFLKALPKVREMGFDDQFIRMWDYYLAYCEGGFLEHAIGCVHLQFHKPGFRRILS